MELTETIERINKNLVDHFGKFEDGQPIWRVVWSEDQFELRYGTYQRYNKNIYLGEFTGVINVPKYRQWIKEKYVLERILPVPELNRAELVTKTTYEPVWTFEDVKGNYLPPKWEATKLIVETIYQQASKTVGAKYKHPESDPKIANEVKMQRLNDLQEELFGNESAITDALKYGEGVGYTGPIKES